MKLHASIPFGTISVTRNFHSEACQNTPEGFVPVEWDRKEEDRACSISVSIEADVVNRNEWDKIARFHAEMTKQLADCAFYPYQQEIQALDSTF